MTPEQCARFILSDCQDPELRAIAEREADKDFAEALLDPVFKAKWDANLKAFADDIDRRAAEYAYAQWPAKPTADTSDSHSGRL